MGQPQLVDVIAAAGRQAGRVVRTPLLESLALNNMCGARILVKAECVQTAGSFKIRGALNRVLCLSKAQRARGVVAFSSGNFGQGLAAACGMLNVQCTIVMPGDAPSSKQERAQSYGSAVVLSEVVDGVNREVTAAKLAERLSREKGFVLLHPFEDTDVIAGQGTCALEICSQCEDKGLALDVLLIPTGGGGLSAGCCLVMEKRMPSAEVFSVEPEGYDDHARSMREDQRLAVEGAPPTLCDSLQAEAPGHSTWPINRRVLSGGIAVSDDEVRHAMRVAFETLQVVLEPGGATALAAVLFGKVPGGVVGRTLCVIASGGNLSLEKFSKIVGSSSAAPSTLSFDWTGLGVMCHRAGSGSMSRPLLLVEARHGAGYLACGYVNVAAANKLGEVCAVVRDVARPEDMLSAPLVGVSERAARELGLAVGMSGAEALRRMRARSPPSKL